MTRAEVEAAYEMVAAKRNAYNKLADAREWRNRAQERVDNAHADLVNAKQFVTECEKRCRELGLIELKEPL